MENSEQRIPRSDWFSGCISVSRTGPFCSPSDFTQFFALKDPMSLPLPSYSSQGSKQSLDSLIFQFLGSDQKDQKQSVDGVALFSFWLCLRGFCFSPIFSSCQWSISHEIENDLIVIVRREIGRAKKQFKEELDTLHLLICLLNASL